jgi:hypothetical protein
MKRLMAIALVAAGVVLPACAQRGGGSRGSVSAHSASAFHSSFAPTTHFSYAPRPAVSTSRFVAAAPAYRSGGGYLRPIRPIPVHGPGRYYGVGLPYGYPGGYGVGWAAPYSLGYPGDDIADPGYAAPPDDPNAGYAAPDQASAYLAAPPDQGASAPPDAYQAYAQPAPAAQPTPEPEEAITLIFKDGRTPEQIHNYMLTRTMLYVRDQHKRDIPVADLDLVATAKANHVAGIDFQVPGGQ